MKAGAISAIFSNLQVRQLCLPLLRLFKDAIVFGEIMSGNLEKYLEIKPILPHFLQNGKSDLYLS